jgi:cell division protein ZapA
MSPGPVAIRIGGQTYRVKAHATEQQLQHLAATVDTRLRQLSGSASAAASPQTLLLVAISLAHELETERAAHQKLRAQTREILQLLLEQVDRTLVAADATLNSSAHPATSSDA